MDSALGVVVKVAVASGRISYSSKRFPRAKGGPTATIFTAFHCSDGHVARRLDKRMWRRYAKPERDERDPLLVRRWGMPRQDRSGCDRCDRLVPIACLGAQVAPSWEHQGGRP
jgi:hypothetical protein